MEDDAKQVIHDVVEQVATALSIAATAHRDELAGRRIVKTLLATTSKLTEKYPRQLIMLAMWNILAAMAQEWVEGRPLDYSPPAMEFCQLNFDEGIPASELHAILTRFLGRDAYVQAAEYGSRIVLCISEIPLTRVHAWEEWQQHLKEVDEE